LYRIIFINESNFRGIFKLSAEIREEELYVRYELFKIIGNVTESIIDSLTNRANLDQSVFKSLDKELIIGDVMSFDILNKKYIEFDNILKEIKDKERRLIFFPRLKILLSYINIMIVNNFLKQIVDYYDVIKMKLIGNVVEEKIEKKMVENERVFKKPIENKLIETDDNTFVEGYYLIKDIYKMVPNNLVKYFLTKIILIELENGLKYKKIDEFYTNENNIIKIKINKLLISNGFIKDIFVVLNSFDFDKDICLSKVLLLYKQLVYIVQGIIENYEINYMDDRKKIENIYLPIKIIEILMFIYILKYSNKNILMINPIVLNNYIHYLVNEGIKFTQEKYKNGFNKSILFETDVEERQNVEYSNKIIEAINKYKYLIDIDKSSFINYALTEIVKPKEKKIIKFSEILPLNMPSLIDINELLNDNNNINHLLNYKLINTNNNKQLKEHKIISKPYYDLVRMLYLPTDTVNLLKTNIINTTDMNPIVLKYSNNIINDIFRNTSSLVNKNEPVSVLYLLDYTIRPYINLEETSFETISTLLYQIMIPHLYDMYGITQFIDFFH